MGCYLGSSIFRTSGCSAVIVSDGKPNVEKTSFPTKQKFSIYMLKTTSCGSYIGGGTLYWDYWDRDKWVVWGSWSVGHASGYGYAYVGFDNLNYDWNVWMRLRWGECTKVFKLGNPTSSPCDFRQNLGVASIDDATNKMLPGSTWSLTYVPDSQRVYTAVTGADGRAIISSLCLGEYDVIVSANGYKTNTARLSVTATENLISRLKVITPTDNASMGYVDSQISAERTQRQAADTQESTDRQNADNTLTSQLTAEKNERNNTDKGIIAQIQDTAAGLWKGLSEVDGKIKAAMADIPAMILSVVISSFIYILESVLESEKK